MRSAILILAWVRRTATALVVTALVSLAFALGCSNSLKSPTAPPVVTFSHGYNDEPSWSKDGQRILYVHLGQTAEEIAAGTDRQIWLLDLNTGLNRFLVPGLSPIWMPDDSTFLYTSQVGIGRFNVSNGTSSVVYSCGGPFLARPAPDNHTITCTSHCGHPNGVDYVWKVDLASGAGRCISQQDSVEWRSASWSPSGTQLAYLRFSLATARFELFTMDTSGANSTQLRAESDFDDDDPTWSHDGNWIFFRRAGTSPVSDNGVWRIHPDGTGAQLIVPGGSKPSCSPLDTALVFAYYDPITNSNDVWMSRADGSGLRRVAVHDTVGASTAPSWRASSRCSGRAVTRRQLYR